MRWSAKKKLTGHDRCPVGRERLATASLPAPATAEASRANRGTGNAGTRRIA
jgi:hypothetical protein